MDDDIPFFSGLRISIIGLGLMGGSLALALKGRCESLVVMDIDPSTIDLARQMKVADRLSTSLEETLQGADVIILSTPVQIIIQLLQNFQPLPGRNVVVLDLGSTKSEIVAAMSDLPEGYDPIGGHPMCGKESLSLHNADPSLYKDAPFAFVRLDRTTAKATGFAEALCRLLAAQPIWIDAAAHDRWTASTSHLPYILSSALVQSLPEEVVPLIGTGFESTSRLAATPSSMMVDVLKTNRKNVLEAIDSFQATLTELRNMISTEQFDQLTKRLNRIAQKKQALTGK